MRKKIWGIALLMLAALGFTLGSVVAWQGTPGKSPYADQNSVAPMLNGTLATYYAELSQEEIDGLLYMVEEEKLARDVYLTLYEQWSLPVFGNIAESEGTHMNAVLSLIEKYNLTAPDTLDQVGVFQNEELQALYDQLVEMGSASLEEALKVGALIEETDIKDLEDWIVQTDNEDIKTVYTNLMAGSENHLRAFVGQLERLGVDYTAQVLPQEQVDEILSSAPTRGMGGMGRATERADNGHGMRSRTGDCSGNAGSQGRTADGDGLAQAFKHAWGQMKGSGKGTRGVGVSP
ncbi:MAG TPA: DUF2202 domain-containing protein [Thermococcaceae archaeon]|jgi:hypothetical protein|uniref:DUF2202 domain-containing protein n=1 Tax=Thermococcus sibiricus (strain DSM 12597 / MM 739) TaxID=604354 RepID=C6A3N2_THESM|nr:MULTISPECIES: DUF2202 domain-containing protein [Thermococcus]KUJ99541.1 MAG: Uncharacterized protein XD43_0795 [Thermococcales archaeon 44_46]KUK29239.1 MAG: Uncharacterized protein XD61_0240 [Thermococcus sp. 40_45]HIH72026.1 DUF2202 domain-containing protein [Thermococcaceae archaeon]ACS90227.1 hypothetical protein TSIB_1173 [Thermococcus sibiricus MM 739]MCA6214867.1 DUF2202 domain-containing protein [Thermococcus bergensis]